MSNSQSRSMRAKGMNTSRHENAKGGEEPDLLCDPRSEFRLRGGRKKGEDIQWHEANNAKRQKAAVKVVDVVEGRLLVFIGIVFIIGSHRSVHGAPIVPNPGSKPTVSGLCAGRVFYCTLRTCCCPEPVFLAGIGQFCEKRLNPHTMSAILYFASLSVGQTCPDTDDV